MRRIFVYIFVAVLAAASYGPHFSFAHAQVNHENDATNIDKLLVVTDESKEFTEEEKFEMAHDGLLKALDLTTEKIDTLTSELESRPFGEESNEGLLKSQFLSELVSFREYYEGKKLVLGETVTLDEIKTLAQEVKTYRDETYSPVVEDIVEFVLVFYSEDVIATANDRFEKISGDIEKLETLGLIEQGIFLPQLEESRSLLEEATVVQSEAKEKVLNIAEVAPVDSELNLTESDSAIEGEKTEETTENSGTDEAELDNENAGEENVEQMPRNMLETSLTNVKAAYAIFLEISKLVKETLGLE